jgi:hypothetical protein
MAAGAAAEADVSKKKQVKKKRPKLTYRAAIKLMDKYGSKGRLSEYFIISLCIITIIVLFVITTQDGVQYNQLSRSNDASTWWSDKLSGNSSSTS